MVASHGGHAVQFFEDDAFLCDVVANFLATGLAAGEAAVVIAEENRREEFRAHLEARGFDVARAEHSGLLTMLDARDTLARLVHDGLPDAEAFDRVIGGTFARVRAERPRAPVRAYGEMVDVLVREGNPRGAINLENLWNELGARQTFSLLCAYSMRNFPEAQNGALFREVCAAHSHVRPTESFVRIDGDDARSREIAELQQRAFALETEVQQRRRSEEDLRVALRVRDDFVSIAGHELRTPITALRLQLGMLARRGGHAPLITRADRQVSRLAALIEQLLEVTRSGGSSLPLAIAPVDLVELTRHVVEQIELPEPRTIRVEAAEPVVARVDALRVEQVLVNLLCNAMKYGRHEPISVSVHREPDTACIAVRDGGIGIPRDARERIFERFERAVSGGDYAGLGLGLWITRKIVEAHGGTITVESELGVGSTFTVRFPLS